MNDDNKKVKNNNGIASSGITSKVNTVTPTKLSEDEVFEKQIGNRRQEIKHLEELLKTEAPGIAWCTQAGHRREIERIEYAYKKAGRNNDKDALDDGKYDFIRWKKEEDDKKEKKVRTLKVALREEMENYIWWLHSALDVYLSD